MFDDLSNENKAPKRGASGTSSSLIKSWAMQHWQLPEHTTLFVSELQCGESDCPDVETVIAILSVAGTDKTVKLKKPIYSIQEADIESIDIWHDIDASGPQQ